MRGALWLTFLLFQDEKRGRCPRKSLVKIRKIAKNIFCLRLTGGKMIILSISEKKIKKYQGV
jgi:hypothetical protein